jgi:hypothetical protein
MQVKNNSSSKIINLSFKQNNYQFSTELLKPLNTFYNEVCSYLQISPNDHDLYYNNKKLTTNYNNSNQTLSDVIQSGTESFFKITQKKSRTPYKLKLRSDTLDVYKSEKSSFSSRKNLQKNFLTLPKKDNKPRVNNMRYINPVNNNYENLGNGVIISQVPTVQDIQNILQNFNNKQIGSNLKTNNNFNGKQGALSVLGNNSVRVDFQDEMTLNEFISYISYMKYENAYYKNMIIRKDNSNIKKNRNNFSYSHKDVRIFLSKFNKKYNDFNNKNNAEQNSKIKINDVIKALKEHELNNDCYHGLCLNRDGENEIITDYYKQQNFLRNSSPYISEEEKRILEEKESKKHFVDQHKNFVTSVGKYSMKPNFIPNYVGMTPSENPNDHLFRSVDKKKWITNKGFSV